MGIFNIKPRSLARVLGAKSALLLHSAVALLLLFPLLAWSVFQSWEHANAIKEAEMRALTRSLAQREYVLMEGARSFLRALSFNKMFTDAKEPFSPEETKDVAERFAQIQNNHLGMFAFLPDGRPLFAFVDGKLYTIASELVTSAPYFHAADGKGMHVGPPLTLRTGQHIVPVSGAVRDNTGKVSCVFMLPLDMRDERQHIQRIARTLALPMQQRIVLRDCAGTSWELAPDEGNAMKMEAFSPLMHGTLLSAPADSDMAERYASWVDSNGTRYVGFMVEYQLNKGHSLPCGPSSLQILGVIEPVPFLTFLFQWYHWQMAGILGVLLVALLLARYIGHRYFTSGLERLAWTVNASCAAIEQDHIGKFEGRAGELHGCREIMELGASYDAMMTALQDSTEQLRKLSTTDALTGLLNRREFSVLADKELARAQRTGHPLSFAMMDLDLFKQVNDRYGHAAGDAVLQTFANLLHNNLRQNDIIGRYGGEEFVLCLPETDKDAAMTTLEKIRKMWTQMEVSTASGTIFSTVSGGVHSLRMAAGSILSLEARGKLLETSIAYADSALYHAKGTGRNRVLFWSDVAEKD